MITIFLALLIILQCCSILFAFVPTTKGASSSSRGSSSGGEMPIVVPRKSNNNIIADIICDGADCECVTSTTRRNALRTSLSLLTTTTSSCFLPHEAFALDEDDAPSSSASVVVAKPFTVLLAIQIIHSQTTPEITSTSLLSEIEIECRPDWAPLASNRFKELVQLGFYNDCPFFRVLPGYIAQFGISANPKLNRQWMYCVEGDVEEVVEDCKPSLRDEPSRSNGNQSNTKGTLSFASSGRNSRRTQVFINAGDNSGSPNYLDAKNFVPFARVVRGMDVVEQLNGEYGGKVSQGKGAYYGGEYFEKEFPRLSVIRDAKLMM
mmetsp:Transcript_28717/g.52416  ORF Transcript_28717/g.52416 Transcript_28717/m.52416 type:complete len:321 (+) Transcript_28717:146-1108(+)|eukprot:CAMPEP_0196152656 /NCGR_PEP_ID=MMETSP0910-20130528/35848_1 /TAXON_ID=49265 /ORGANISM="Thalassiosira rotula, Strain GSO102" /LENGTH=320 /DNA_ID=CAMNT_0041416299 /DNA_START=112 /DNA_END=1074 /DNA_ORIENTATION=-